MIRRLLGVEHSELTSAYSLHVPRLPTTIALHEEPPAGRALAAIDRDKARKAEREIARELEAQPRKLRYIDALRAKHEHAVQAVTAAQFLMLSAGPDEVLQARDEVLRSDAALRQLERELHAEVAPARAQRDVPTLDVFADHSTRQMAIHADAGQPGQALAIAVDSARDAIADGASEEATRRALGHPRTAQAQRCVARRVRRARGALCRTRREVTMARFFSRPAWPAKPRTMPRATR